MTFHQGAKQKLCLKKCRDSIKLIVTLAEIQSAREAYLTV